MQILGDLLEHGYLHTIAEPNQPELHTVLDVAVNVVERGSGKCEVVYDIGVSQDSLCSNADMMTDLQPLPPNTVWVKGFDGKHATSVRSKGRLVLKMAAGDLIIENVYYVPESDKTLLSWHSLHSNGVLAVTGGKDSGPSKTTFILESGAVVGDADCPYGKGLFTLNLRKPNQQPVKPTMISKQTLAELLGLNGTTVNVNAANVDVNVSGRLR